MLPTVFILPQYCRIVDFINKSNEKEETIEAAAISADSTAALAYLIFPTVFSDTSDVSLFF